MKVKQKRATLAGEFAQKRQPRAKESQIDSMVDYLVLHPNVATGKFDTMHGNQDLQGSWADLARILNSQFEDGKSKDIESWKTTWRDNKTKVSNKFIALKNLRKATGNNPIDIKLTERDEKIMSLLGYDYIEGLDTVPDSFPEEHNNVNELLTDGNESILAVAPQSTSIRSTTLTGQRVDIGMEDTSTSERPQNGVIDSIVTSEYVSNQTVPENGTRHYSDESRPNSSGTQQSVRQLEPELGTIRAAESPQDTTSNILDTCIGSRTSRWQVIKRGKHHERLGIQLQHAQAEFAEIAQRTCEATELMAQAEMKRAEAALIIANNDKTRNEILRMMAENDKARNVVLVGLIGTLDALLRK